MTALLVVITLASLALAGALMVYVLKLAREERDRSDARAAALAELLETQAPAELVPPSELEPAVRVEPPPAVAFEPTETADQWRETADWSRTSDLFASANARP